jgi:hypothetical protein
MTPHQRRVRELTALRRVIADCERHISSSTITTEALATIFEQHTSALPDESRLKAQLKNLATALRRGSAAVICQVRSKCDPVVPVEK